MNLPVPVTSASPPGLVDHLGRPLRAEQMRQEVAGPTTAGVRSIVTGHPADGLTPERLAQLLKAAEQGDATAYLELAEQMEEKDLHYLSVLGTRKRAVSQLPIEVVAASDSPEHEGDAQLIRDWLQRDTLETELFDILDAVGKGYSVTELIWEMSSRLWVPGKLKWRDPRWFEFDQVDGETIKLRTVGPSEPLAGFKYITHVHPAKSGLAIRGGLARPVAWFYLFKNYSVKDWVTFMDAYGMPLRVGKYENGTTEDNIRLLLRALAMLGSDAAAAIPKSMEVEFIDRKGGENGDFFERFATWADLQVSKGVLGQTSTTDALAGGLGSGQANTHNDVRGDIERADAKLLSATLTRDVAIPMVMLNRGRRDAYPRIRIGRPEQVDLNAYLKSVDAAVRHGVPVGIRQFREKTGLTEPEPGEELLAAPRPVAGEDADKRARSALEGQTGPEGAKDPATGLSEPLMGADGDEKGSAAATIINSGWERWRQDHENTYAVAKAYVAELRATAATENDGGNAPADPIEAAAERQADDWQRLITAITDPVADLVARAGSLAEIRDGLLALEEQMDAGELREQLARGLFAARLAGDAAVGREMGA